MRYILFDLDGTLTDPKLGICSCVQHALEKMGIEEPDLDKLEPFIGPPLTDSFKEFYGFNDEDTKKAISFYRERFSTVGKFENEVYPGIPELLKDLKKKGKYIAIASSKPTVFVEDILKHFEIREYFDFIAGSELDGTRAKKEEVLEYALNGMFPDGNVEYDEIVMVGDRKFDIEGAHKIGVGNIGVTYGYGSREELEEAGADKIVNTVEGLRLALMPVFNQVQTAAPQRSDPNSQQTSGGNKTPRDWRAESKSAGKQSFANMWGFFGPAFTLWIGGSAVQYILLLIINQICASNESLANSLMPYSVPLGHVVYVLGQVIAALILYFQFRKTKYKIEPNQMSMTEKIIYVIPMVLIGIGFIGFINYLGIWEVIEEYKVYMDEKYSLPMWLGILLYGIGLPLAFQITFVRFSYLNARRFMKGNMPLIMTFMIFAFLRISPVDGLFVAVVLALSMFAVDKTKDFLVSTIGFVLTFTLVWIVESTPTIKGLVSNRSCFGTLVLIGIAIYIVKASLEKRNPKA